MSLTRVADSGIIDTTYQFTTVHLLPIASGVLVIAMGLAIVVAALREPEGLRVSGLGLLIGLAIGTVGGYFVIAGPGVMNQNHHIEAGLDSGGVSVEGEVQPSREPVNYLGERDGEPVVVQIAKTGPDKIEWKVVK